MQMVDGNIDGGEGGKSLGGGKYILKYLQQAFAPTEKCSGNQLL